MISFNIFGGGRALRIAVGIIALAILLLASLADVGAEVSSCSVSGYINADTIWSPTSCDPYIVTGSVIVQSGVTLTIQPGTNVKFNSLKALDVQGTLIARGTAANQINFTSNLATPAKGDWGYIHFTDSSTDAAFDGTGNYISGSIIQYAIIEYAGGVSVSDYDGLRIEASSPYIDHDTIRDNNNRGIYVWSNGAPHVTNNAITGNTGHGIYAASGPVTISGNTVTGNTGIGIYVDGGTTATISGNTITGNTGGIAVSGIVTISGNTITGNRVYGYGGGISASGNVTISNNIITGNTATTSYWDPHGIGGGISAGSSTVTISRNTITNNTAATKGGGIYLPNGIRPTINDNNIYSNIMDTSTPNDIWNDNIYGGENVNSKNNYWGTTNTSVIDNHIWDFFDDSALGIVDYTPFLTTPIEAEPVLSVTANPTSVTAGTATDVVFTVTSSGSAVSGATVNLSGLATGSGITNASGLAVISVNAIGTGIITATASMTGYTSGSTTITATPTPIGFNGTIRDFSTTLPIHGAIIEAMQTDIIVASVASDANGNYVLSVPSGNYKLNAKANGFIREIKSNVSTGTTVNFTLRPGEELIFDEFVQSTLNTSEWIPQTTGIGNISIYKWINHSSLVVLSSGYGGAGSANIISKKSVRLADYDIVIFEGKISAYEDNNYAYGDKQPRGLRVGGDGNNAIEFISSTGSSIQARTVSSGVATTTNYNLGESVNQEKYIYRIEANLTIVKFYLNETLIAIHTKNIPTGNLSIYVGTNYAGYGNVPVGADYLYLAVIGIDIIPPSVVTNLTNISFAPTYIKWTWTDPSDPDFSNVIIYLDGGFQTNVTKGVQYYNATALTEDTTHTISTRTGDIFGNINQTWVNHTATTLSLGDLRGDVNRNGIRDTGDSTLILSYIAELQIPVEYLPILPIGDMNCNDMIDTGDATLVLRDIVGLPISRCWE